MLSDLWPRSWGSSQSEEGTGSMVKGSLCSVTEAHGPLPSLITDRILCTQSHCCLHLRQSPAGLQGLVSPSPLSWLLFERCVTPWNGNYWHSSVHQGCLGSFRLWACISFLLESCAGLQVWHGEMQGLKLCQIDGQLRYFRKLHSFGRVIYGLF